MPLNDRQTCGLDILARLSWAYLAKMSEGRSFDAMPYLDVFRATYGVERSIIAPGLPAALAGALPTSLATMFDDRMRLAQQIVLTTAISGAGVSGISSTVSTMPRSAGELGAWFRTRLQAAVPEPVQARLRDYLEIPSGSSNFAVTLATVVRDDRRCVATAPPPPVPDPTPPPAPPPASGSPTGPTRNGSTSSSGGGSGSNSTAIMVGAAAIAVAGAFYVSSQKKGKGLSGSSMWETGDGRAAYAKAGPTPVQKLEAKYEVSLTTRRMEREVERFSSVSDAMAWLTSAQKSGKYKTGQINETANGKRRMIRSF